MLRRRPGALASYVPTYAHLGRWAPGSEPYFADDLGQNVSHTPFREQGPTKHQGDVQSLT